MSYLHKVDSLTGNAIENKIICCSKRALANLYILFKTILNKLTENKLYNNIHNENSFHIFMEMLDMFNNLIEKSMSEDRKITSLSRVDCIPKSNKFFFPTNLITLKQNNNLILKFDDDLNKEELVSLNDLIQSTKINFKMTKFIEFNSVKMDNIFGNVYSCNVIHDHKNCEVNLNCQIQKERDSVIEFNQSELGINLFDKIMSFIKMLQFVDIEFMCIIYLKLARKENLTLSEIKDKISPFSRKINLVDFAYYLLLNTINNKLTQSTLELVECHLEHTSTPIIVNWPTNSKILMFD